MSAGLHRAISRTPSNCELTFRNSIKSHCIIDSSSLNLPNIIHSYIKHEVEALAKAKGYDEELKTNVAAKLFERFPSNYLQVVLIREALKAEEKWYAEKALDEVHTLSDLDPLYDYFKSKLIQLPREDGSFFLEILSALAVANRSFKSSDVRNSAAGASDRYWGPAVYRFVVCQKTGLHRKRCST
ncbi:hypothetical protein F4801DRAFT_97248 [Xylaria longipes]|nr:hypothetical protein F4801DRAFT_97248 [Xylaria longipes]